MTDKNKRKPELSNMVYGKVPPQAPDLEEAVLGAIMLEADTLDLVLEILPHADVFYIDAHQKIYRTILDMHNNRRPIDLLTITEQLRKVNELEIIGGAYYLTKLTMAVMSSAHAEEHARIVYEKFIQRELIRIGGITISNAYDDNTDAFDLLEHAQNELQALSDIPGATNTLHISASASQVMKDILEIRDKGIEITGITTGYPSIDRAMYGWQKTDLTILAARPSVGKTAFALNLAFNAVKDKNKKVKACIFSLEMGHKRITKRGLAFSGKVSLEVINRPVNLTDHELERLHTSVIELKRQGIYLDDTPLLSTQGLRRRMRKLMKTDPEAEWLFIVDYLQLMVSSVKGNSVEQITQISRDLKLIPKELEVSLIALSQLNRDKDSDEAPTLRDLRGSGSIEQDADNVMFLYRPSKQMIQERPDAANKICLSGQKFRDGVPFELLLQFEKEYQLFVEPEPFNPFKQQQPDNPMKGIKPNYQNTNFNSAPNFNPNPQTIDDLPF